MVEDKKPANKPLTDDEITRIAEDLGQTIEAVLGGQMEIPPLTPEQEVAVDKLSQEIYQSIRPKEENGKAI